eukprot:jgi/Undpi1/3386/HiC_scaffold_15.g06759.m1
MIRVRSLAVTCARRVSRSSFAAKGVVARPATVCHATQRAFSDSLRNLAQQPPPQSAGSPEHDDRVPSERAVGAGGAMHGSLQQNGEVEEAGYMLQRQIRAENGWTESTAEFERARLLKDLIFKIRRLSKSDPFTKVDKAISLLDKGREEGASELPLYNAVFKQLLSASRRSPVAPKQMSAVVQRLQDDALTLDVKTYNHILDFYAQVHDSKNAQETYDDMVSNGVTPNERTLSYMIMAHSWGCPNAMYRAVTELNSKGWRATRGAYLGMIAVMVRHNDWTGILHTIRRMRAESKKPTEAAFVAAFRAAHKRREPDTCKELFEHRMEVGLLPQEYAYVKMMVVLLEDGRAHECLEYWRQLVCVNGLNGLEISRETYNFTIKAAAEVDWDEMEAVVGMMQAQGLRPTDKTYRAALNGLNKRGQPLHGALPEWIARAFTAIEGAGAPPGTSLQQKVAVVYANGEMWQEAVDCFQNVLSRRSHLSTQGWECLVKSQFKLGKYADMMETWTRGAGATSERDEDKRPDPELFVLVAEACLKTGDMDGTAKYCEEAKKHGLAASEEALAFAGVVREGEEEGVVGEGEEAGAGAERGAGGGGGSVEDDAEAVSAPPPEGGEPGAGSSPINSSCVGVGEDETSQAGTVQ